MPLLIRLFSTLSHLIGALIVAALFASLLAGLIRFGYISVTDPVTNKPHFLAKQEYLANMPSAKDNAPNIIVIFFDDLGWGDLSSYGNQLIETPNIDAIAKQGLLMTDFYSASPVCTPSRAALLTGRFPPRTRTDRHVFFPDHSVMGVSRRIIGLANALPKEEITVAEALQHGGYRTGMVGKWHLGDHEAHKPNDFGFEYFYGVLFSNDMFPLHLYHNEDIVIEDQRKGGFFTSERDETRPLPGNGIDQRELTSLYTQAAISFVEKNDDAPFFLYLSHSLPHVPHYASTEFANTSRGGTYGDVVEDLDRSTGALIEALDRQGLADNTIIIITSDNGADYNGSPGGLRGRKGDVLEGGQRVPMIVRWPSEIQSGRVTDEMAMNSDLFPTLLNFAQLPLPQDRIIDGRDITGLLKGDEGSPHEFLYYFPVLETLPAAIRNDEFKLMGKAKDFGRKRMHLSRLNGDTEAHDVQNLYPEQSASMRQALEQKQDEVRTNKRGWSL
jgi:arylsulfatase A-like enzyme